MHLFKSPLIISPKASNRREALPVLMYHEIFNCENSGSINRYASPNFTLSIERFEEQLQFLKSCGYESTLLSNINALDWNQKYVVLTFDDGLHGNYMYALPLLKRYGFNAIFFIAAGKIGSDKFMTWAEVETLSRAGMSIQSHTVSHRPLELLSDSEVFQELHSSKCIIEERLGSEVTMISFPHGSYNKRIITIAAKAGYNIICTSKIQCNRHAGLKKTPAIFGRISIKANLSLDKFIRLVQCDRKVIFPEMIMYGVKKMAKKFLGIERYLSLYRVYYRISNDSDK